MRVLLVILALAQAGAPPAAPAPATGVIAGRVIDGASGQAVTGVVVTLISRPGPGAPVIQSTGEFGAVAAQPLSVLVDGSGRFVFSGLRAGTYDLTATRRGYVSGAFGRLRPDGAATSFVMAEKDRQADITLRVWKHASIAGSVSDEANEPVVGIWVALLKREWIAGELRLNAAGGAMTDDRGAYRIGSLSPGDYIVAIPATMTTFPLELVDLAAGPNPPAEALAAVNLVARVSLAPGTRDAQRVGDRVLHEATRGAVQPPPAADGSLMVYPPAYFPEVPASAATAATITIAAGDAKSIPPMRLHPMPTVRVSGKVTTSAGPVGTTLSLIPQHVDNLASESSFQVARTVSNTAGDFLFLGVTPGTYRLRAHNSVGPAPPPGFAAPGYSPSTAQTYWLNETVTVSTTDVSLTLTMRPAFSVGGQLIFEGQRAQPDPRQIARDVIGLGAADGRSVSSLTGRDLGAPPGGFTIAEVPGGRFLIRPLVTPSGWFLKSITRDGVDAIDVPIDVSSDIRNVVVTYTDRPTAIRGSVTTSDGQPDPAALVIVFPANPERWIDSGRTPLRIRSVRAAFAGAYSLNSLPPGEYLIAAVADISASTWHTPKFLEAASRQAMRIRLDPGMTLTHDLRRLEIK